MKQRGMLCFLAALLLFSFGGFGRVAVYAAEAKESWAIYWYLCGSDLESEQGCATADLLEMMEVQLPSNVEIVIQTGGASAWQNDWVDAQKQQRWLMNEAGFSLLEEAPLANMGEAETLRDFLDFASKNFPADKTAVIFWNHGGGTLGGTAFDEVYDYDALSLQEIYQALDAVFGANPDAPALEMIGFDTCLMATIDVAALCQNFAHYLVASEEMEAGNGWDYGAWLQLLSRNPAMDGAALGEAICNTYYADCKRYGTAGQATLSVVDLTKLAPLLDAYEAYGEAALQAAAQDAGFYSAFARAAYSSENYGGNHPQTGFSNMVDLGHLARSTARLLPEAKDVLSALEDCVLYRIQGAYRKHATGLSCYYPYSGSVADYQVYQAVGTGEAFQALYGYALTGKQNVQYLQSLGIQEMPKPVGLQDMLWDGKPLDLNEEGIAYLTLGPAANQILASIGFVLYYVDAAQDRVIALGADNDMLADWENGVFYDNFRCVWGAIDGHFVYMELSFEGDEYNQYAVPILLNGEKCYLQVIYDFSEGEWEILGASGGMSEDGMASKELRLLESGDTITTLWKMGKFSDTTMEFYEAEEFTVTEQTAFREKKLEDGTYAMLFDMQDVQGNHAYSDMVTFDCRGDEIEVTVNGMALEKEDAQEDKQDVPGVEADEAAVVLEWTIGEKSYRQNGVLLEQDTAPLLCDGRTMLPIRTVANALGAEVRWDADAQMVWIEKDDTTIGVPIGADVALVNGVEMAQDAAAFVENGRTYLPLRFVAEYLGADVRWDADAQTVTIIG